MRKLDIVELCNRVAFCVNGVRVENPFYYFVPANAVISWSFLANSLDGFCFFKHLFFRRFVPKYYLAGVPFETGLAELSDYRRIGGLRQGTTRLIRI